jgi:nucleoside transporter
MNPKVRFQLSVMMFLEYVIWGAWLPMLTKCLNSSFGFTEIQIAWIQNTFAIASITAMFVGGQLADRYIATEKFLAISHLMGGLTMLALPFCHSFGLFFALMLAHCFFYVPTLSLTNSICFANIQDAQKDFGFIRLWGTIGWIAVGWPFIFLLVDWAKVPAWSTTPWVEWLGKVLGTAKTGSELAAALPSIFVVSGIASLFLAGFCLTLPHTPPVKTAAHKNAPWEAIKLLSEPSILVLFLVTFIDAVVLYCYFFWTGDFLTSIGVPGNWIMPTMSIGQIAEIGTMAGLGFFLKRLGWRKTMMLGLAGQVVRFAIYAVGNQQLAWLVVGSNLIHGLCYAFFFATVYIFVDEHFPKDARVSAQGLFNFLIVGLGPFAGNFLWAWLGSIFKTVKTVTVAGVAQQVTRYQFNQLFCVPTGIALLATLVFIVAFHPKESKPGVGASPP